VPIDKEKLLAKRLKTETVEIPDVGDVVVRALTRAEAFQFTEKDLEPEDMERRLLAAALVDPQLTLDEVAEWHSASAPGEIQPVVQAILRLSGLEVDAPKKAYQQFRE
jgi:hypothetical protein